jgi:hypothetical protein
MIIFVCLVLDQFVRSFKTTCMLFIGRVIRLKVRSVFNVVSDVFEGRTLELFPKRLTCS